MIALYILEYGCKFASSLKCEISIHMCVRVYVHIISMTLSSLYLRAYLCGDTVLFRREHKADDDTSPPPRSCERRIASSSCVRVMRRWRTSGRRR